MQAPTTILVLDDEPRVRILVVRLLASLGYEVLEAQDAEEAFELVGREPITLLIADLTLPGMDGREAATRMVSMVPELRVLFASGDDRGIVLGPGERFLAKPFTYEALVREVRAILEEH